MWILISSGSSRRYASGEITSDIGKGPKRRLSSLRDRLRIVMFFAFSQTLSPILKIGAGD